MGMDHVRTLGGEQTHLEVTHSHQKKTTRVNPTLYSRSQKRRYTENGVV